MFKATLLISLLSVSLLAPASRYWRVSEVQAASSAGSEVQLSVKGAHALGQIAVTAQGPYLIKGFRAENCAGSIALLQLGRNAEGMSILQQRLSRGISERGVILAGQRYAEYPALAFTLATFKHRVARLFAAHSTAPVAIAYAETGDCNLAAAVQLSSKA